jgi:hypothetical protein
MWTYEQSTGFLKYPDGTILDKGYAGGNLGRVPEGKNNPCMENVSCVGPLPRGKYTMATVYDHSRLGPFAIELVGDVDNESFGRSGFFIHGDKIGTPGVASEGCIVLSRAARNKIWESGDHRLEVVI